MSPLPPDSAITAVVCNYNGEHYLEECLEALRAEELIDEVIVVDNASEDDGVALVREKFPEVEIVELDRNRGPCAPRNIGMRRAKNRYVLGVDNDAVVQPGMVPKLFDAIRSRPRCAVAQPRALVYDEPTRIHYDAGDFHYVGLLSLRNFYREVKDAEGEGIVSTNAIIGISPLVDRDAVLAAGGYDEAYFYLVEDFDLALRLRQADYQILAVEDAIVLHKAGTKGLSFRGGGYPKERTFLHSRNRWLLLAKCYRIRTLLVALPGILVYEIAWLFFTASKGHLGAHLRGKVAFVKMLPEVVRKRRMVAVLRRVRDRELLVGGPLTFSPSLVASGPARLAAGALDAILRAWWVLAKWLSA